MQDIALILLGVILTLAVEGAVRKWHKMMTFKEIRARIIDEDIPAFCEWKEKQLRGGKEE